MYNFIDRRALAMNTNRKFGSALQWIPAWGCDADGNIVHLQISVSQFDAAVERDRVNPEDRTPRPSRLRRVLHALFGP
jgi:hypothetical protein